MLLRHDVPGTQPAPRRGVVSENLLVFGLPGRGKSHVIAAIGHELIRHGYRVLFTPTFALVQRLLAAKRDLRLERELATAIGGSFACTIQYIGSERLLECSGDNAFGQRALQLRRQAHVDLATRPASALRPHNLRRWRPSRISRRDARWV